MVNQISSNTKTTRNVDATPIAKVLGRSPQAVDSTKKVTTTTEKQGSEQQRTLQSQSSFLVNTLRANRYVSQAQSTMQSIQQATNLLQQLKTTARKLFSTKQAEKEQIQQNVHQLQGKLSNLVKDANYGGEKLLNYDLSARMLTHNDTETFSIKGLRFNKLRQNSEILRFQFEEGKPSTIHAKVDPYQSIDEVADSLDKAFSKRNIGVTVDRFGELNFNVAKDAWPTLERGIWMSGGGQILPSGNPVKAKLENQDKHKMDVKVLDFSKEQSARKAISDIEKIINNLAQEYAKVDQQQKIAVQELEAIMKSELQAASSINQPKDWLSAPDQVSLKLVDNAVPTLLAQANATRHNVVALLEPGDSF